jgi:hydrogenase expression/formation protein HypC
MCIAIPSRVIATDGLVATVECFGQQRQVNLMLMAEPVALGEYLLIQAGGFAYEKVDAARAHEALELFRQILDQTGADPSSLQCG